MNKYLPLFALSGVLVLLVGSINAQDYWSSWNPTKTYTEEGDLNVLKEDSYQAFELNQDALKAELSTIAGPYKNMDQRVRVYLPNIDGDLIEFSVYNNPQMEPGLAKRYPGIQSFAGFAVKNKGQFVRMGYSDRGFHAVITSLSAPKMFINCVNPDQGDKYVVIEPQSVKDVYMQHTQCGVGHEIDEENPLQQTEIIPLTETDKSKLRSGTAGPPVDVHVFRLAIASVAEFSIRNGGSVQSVLGVFNQAVTRLNEIYEAECALSFRIIDRNDEIIFLDPDTDPYEDVNLGRGVLAINHGVLNNIIGPEDYDVGHVFTINCTDGIAGVARPSSACDDNQKGFGVTCEGNSGIVAQVNRVMAHEIGHQFSAGHTWNHCPPSEDQFAAGSACEPGSGSTIMSYAGTCQSSNIVNTEHPNFSYCSIEQIVGFASTLDCGLMEETENTAPDIFADYESGFSIPIETPFRLVASATDMDGDDLTYSWEEVDRGASVPPGTNNIANIPLFRVFPPTDNPERIFPRLARIVNNQLFERDETLTRVGRTFRFRCTARDNQVPGGGVTHTPELRFTANANSGPFLVTSPNDGTEEWVIGETATVTWDVANTDRAPVNCSKVDIMISYDGGFRDWVPIAMGVPNTGSAEIVVPNRETNFARIIVHASDNIFFDMSNTEFRILPATNPGIFFSVTPLTQEICLPDNPSVEIDVEALLGFDSLVTLDVVGLPDGAALDIANNPFRPSEGNTVSIDFANVDITEVAEVTFILSGDDLATPVERPITFDIVSTNFSALQVLNPPDGAVGFSENPTFRWADIPEVDRVDFEISTSPTFEAGTIIQSETGIRADSFLLITPLDKNTPYYWRIKPYNRCGAGGFVRTAGFQTETSSCAIFSDFDPLPLPISKTDVSPVSTTFNLPTGGTISDINVYIVGIHNSIRYVDMDLEGPDGTTVELTNGIRCATSTINFGFDDAATDVPGCPPDEGVFYDPVGELAMFNGRNSGGDWKAVFTPNDNLADGGQIDSIALEICSNVTLNPPFIVTNEELLVKTGESTPLNANWLLTEDNDNSASELTYTVVTLPAFGRLVFNGTDLDIGDNFTQTDVSSGRIRYANDDPNALKDDFDFVVRDPADGWVKDRFLIDINESNPTNTIDQALASAIRMFPNPAQDWVQVEFGNGIPKGAMEIEMYDVQGRLLATQSHNVTTSQHRINTEELPSGVYFVKFVWASTATSKKLSIQR